MKTRTLAPLLTIVLVLAGCSQIQEFQGQIDSVRWCSDVLRLAAAVDTANPEAARNLVDALDRSGPEDLADDVGVVRAKVEEIEAGEAEAKDLPSEDVKDAVSRLVDEVDARCQGEIDEELGSG